MNFVLLGMAWTGFWGLVFLKLTPRLALKVLACLMLGCVALTQGPHSSMESGEHLGGDYTGAELHVGTAAYKIPRFLGADMNRAQIFFGVFLSVSTVLAYAGAAKYRKLGA